MKRVQNKGSEREGLPAGALIGLPVSAGTIEGRARVLLDMAEADLEPGDLLVTAYTDRALEAQMLAVHHLRIEVLPEIVVWYLVWQP